MKQWLAKSRSPTVVEPLRAEWEAAKAAAVTLDRQGKQKEAAAEVQRFRCRPCEVRVLDPACGSGNFLYVTAVMVFAVDHMDRAATVSELWALADTWVRPNEIVIERPKGAARWGAEKILLNCNVGWPGIGTTLDSAFAGPL